MAQHARVEEISDDSSDPEEMDISAFAPSTSGMSSLIEPSNIPSSSAGPPANQQYPSGVPNAARHAAEKERTKRWQCLYPVYFDATRTRAEGRRVELSQAVANPLAREILDAVISLGLKVHFEPEKIHPKDWSNPGRVRVLLKSDGKAVARNVNNKHHLYIFVAASLRNNPTKPETPLRLPIAGISIKEPPLPPAVPRGWKMGTILPLHSPAISGGGVKDNFLKDMMAQMQGEVPDGANGSGGEGKKKKEKKKGRA